MRRVALIDADTLIYLVAYNFKDADHREFGESVEEVTPRVLETADNMVKEILQVTRATHYLGAMGHPFIRCFRFTHAKYAPYKAGRGEEADYVRRWKEIIKTHLHESWGFIMPPGLEADDVISLMAEELSFTDDEYIICSPDKDLSTFPGEHYDYKKLGFADISRQQADWLFWYQMMIGDSTDGVAGLPGVGDKKARDKMKPIEFTEELAAMVKGEYLRYFGDYYGTVIFEENLAVLGLMCRAHLYYEPEYSQFTTHIHPIVGLKEFGM